MVNDYITQIMLSCSYLTHISHVFQQHLYIYYIIQTENSNRNKNMSVQTNTFLAP